MAHGRAVTHAFFATDLASTTSRRVLSTTRQRFVLDDAFLKTVDLCVSCKQFFIVNATYLLSTGNQCQGLASLSGRDSLWGLYNWKYMTLAIAPSRLGSFVSFERRRPLKWLVLFTEAVESNPYPQFIEEVIGIRSKRYKDWNKDHWLCTHKFLSDNIQAWFDERVTKADATAD
ncbi:hypothetical protein J3R83DRAFT_12875 [Lanmaoa asiatica]|nr:hypothetical protein J3R83DRAFT_12875 [Lanmaoa asiatica]